MSERPYNLYDLVHREAMADYDPASHYDAQWDEERWDREETDEEYEARYEAMNTRMDEAAYADYMADIAAVDSEDGDPF